MGRDQYQTRFTSCSEIIVACAIAQIPLLNLGYKSWRVRLSDWNMRDDLVSMTEIVTILS